MNFLQLEYFVLVAETGSFSIAAEKAFTTQSSVSKQIHSLEEELGTSLFYRTASVPLTPSGQIFLPHAQKLLHVYADMRSAAIDFRAMMDETIHLAGISFMTPYRITDIITEYLKDNPQIKLRITERSTQGQLDMLKNKEIDIGIIFSSGQHLHSYNTVTLCSDELVLLVSRLHHLADSCDEIDLESLKDETIALLSPNVDMVLRDYILSLCQKELIYPHLLNLDTWISSIGEYLAKKMCVSIIPKRIAQFYYSGNEIVIIPIRGRPTLDLTLVHRKEPLSAAKKQLIESIKNSFSE